MTKFKSFFYGLSAGVLALPAMVGAQFEIPDPGLVGTPTGGTRGIVGLLTTIMQWLLSLVGIFAVIAFVIAGLMYLTSAGSEEQADRAKKAMIYAVIGIVVALLGLIVLNAVNNMLSGRNEF